MSQSAMAKRTTVPARSPVNVAPRRESGSMLDRTGIMPLANGLTSTGHAFQRVNVFSAPTTGAGPSGEIAQSDTAGGQTPAPAPGVTPPSPPPPAAPAPAAPVAAAVPTLTLGNNSYTDSGNTSHKNIEFNVAVPSGLTATDFALVNKLQGSMKKADGTFHNVRMYGSVVPFNFTAEQVDSVDADPVYWSDAAARWNYTTTTGGFQGTDDPGPPSHAFAKGDVAAVKFKIGLYRLASVPTTTTGTISATPISELPWQYSVAADATTGALSHPAL